jgi:hypothetical protein
MNLHHPLRPISADGRPAWLSGHVPVKPLEIWPLPSGQVKLSIWLPLKSKIFASSQFELEADLDQLPSLIQEFESDPEAFCEKHFSDDYCQPELRETINYSHLIPDEEKSPPNPTPSKPLKRPSPKSLILTDLEF